jgi:hypothetical protein
MELYATGFNALNLLSFEASAASEEPTDLLAFTRILLSKKIERPVSRLCYTIREPGMPVCSL